MLNFINGLPSPSKKRSCNIKSIYYIADGAKEFPMGDYWTIVLNFITIKYGGFHYQNIQNDDRDIFESNAYGIATKTL